jgi:long-chain acyl-CoA synthetase
VAVRTTVVRYSFAELDTAADRFAAGLSRRLRGPGRVVALTNHLDAAFAIAYYGVLRAGHVAAVVNPLLPAPAQADALATCHADACVAPAALLAALAPVRDLAPKLAHLIPPDDVVALPAGEVHGWRPPDIDPDAVACVQFTSGTTGRPKAVRLSHRGLAVNAGQVAAAHGLDGAAVTVNHLPTYHPMHLNSAVHGGATQVLCPEPDAARALALANRYRATHFYSLPVRLARLAVDPRLPQLRLDSTAAILSGGSALPTWAADALTRHLGVAVAQGYGLAEMSPLTHADSLSRPAPGSVGRTVRDTGCRIIDLETRAVLPAGGRGEIQVRGPQRMVGYLDPAQPDGIDAAGWLSTGDIGYLDAAARLFVVDRIKDVFKCDNWLVAPSEIEAVLARHPNVVDCVVVDLPDRFRGGVAGAALVLRPGAVADEVAGWANDRLPEFQHVHAVAVVGQIARSPSGKVRRAELRDLVTAESRWTTAGPAG